MNGVPTPSPPRTPRSGSICRWGQPPGSAPSSPWPPAGFLHWMPRNGKRAQLPRSLPLPLLPSPPLSLDGSPPDPFAVVSRCGSPTGHCPRADVISPSGSEPRGNCMRTASPPLPHHEPRAQGSICRWGQPLGSASSSPRPPVGVLHWTPQNGKRAQLPRSPPLPLLPSPPLSLEGCVQRWLLFHAPLFKAMP